MQFTSFLAAALIAFSATTFAMPTANADVAIFNSADTLDAIAHDEPKGYGYDNNNSNKNKNNNNNNGNGDYGYNNNNNKNNKPINASFCNNARNGKEDECRRAVRECDRKFDNNSREKECAQGVKDKYQNERY